MDIYERLKELGIELPEPLPAGGLYKPVVQCGNTIYVSGQGSFDMEGKPMTGKLGKDLTIAILAPKDDTRNGARYTCTANLLRECPALSSENNSAAKLIVTSHGGLTLNTLIAKI